MQLLMHKAKLFLVILFVMSIELKCFVSGYLWLNLAEDRLERVQGNIKKRQSQDPPPSSHMQSSSAAIQVPVRSGKKRKEVMLSDEDRRSLNAAKLFLSDDNMSLQQAIEKQNTVSYDRKKRKDSSGTYH